MTGWWRTDTDETQQQTIPRVKRQKCRPPPNAFLLSAFQGVSVQHVSFSLFPSPFRSPVSPPFSPPPCSSMQCSHQHPFPTGCGLAVAFSAHSPLASLAHVTKESPWTCCGWGVWLRGSARHEQPQRPLTAPAVGREGRKQAVSRRSVRRRPPRSGPQPGSRWIVRRGLPARRLFPRPPGGAEFFPIWHAKC